MHPLIEAIPNWRLKVSRASPWAARIRRKLKKAGFDFRKMPSQITGSSSGWSEGRRLLNAALSNDATHCATTYGIPIWDPATNRHRPNPDRNEFWDNPELLKFL